METVEKKHTKRPWKVDYDNPSHGEVIYSDHHTVCRVNPLLDEYEANANLIAKAPELEQLNSELLEALNGIFQLIDDGDLVRNTSKDHDMKEFADQSFRITSILSKGKKAISKLNR